MAEKALVVADKKMEIIKVVNPEVLESTIQEIEAIVIEKAFIWESEKLDCYWRVGEALRQAEKDSKANITSLVTRLAKDNRMKNIHLSDRLAWTCIKAFDTFKKKRGVIDWPGGKSATWTKIKTLLIESPEKHEPTIYDVAMRLFKKHGPDQTRELIKQLEIIMKHEKSDI